MLSYGHRIAPEGDIYVTIADMALSGLAKAGIFGTYLVDYIDCCEFVSGLRSEMLTHAFHPVKHVPSWIPGVKFKKQAQEWKQASRAMLNMPFEMVKQQMVGCFTVQLQALS